jgi:hypothetical protein
MINVSTITKQIRDWLDDDPALDGFTIERSEFLNEDAGKASQGWIGIYRQTVDYDPRNLGISPNNYHGEVTFLIFVQRAVLSSGCDAEDALEKDVKTVLDRLVQIPRTHIDHFSDLVIDYTYQETDRATMYFQGAMITVVAQVSFEVK